MVVENSNTTIDLQKYLAGGVSTESPFLTGNGQPFEPDPDNAGGGKRAVHDILPFKGPLRGLFLSPATTMTPGVIRANNSQR
jgi:hypothetical protein